MDITLAILADAANYTLDGKLNILGIFHALTTSNIPFVSPQFAIVISVSVNDNEKGQDIELLLVLRDPEGEEESAAPAVQLPVPVDSPPGRADHSIILNVHNMVFKRFGRYTIDVRLDGQTLREIPLFLVPTGQAQNDNDSN